ncbi:hypothetical protein SNEBB_010736 [Seison nebaliae]|nr:hypothetical protein SNEBB_010736 [Seison nebaliae]
MKLLIISNKLISRSLSSSVNRNELEKFEQFSSRWWNTSGNSHDPFIALRRYNELRVPWIKDNFDGKIKDLKCLDVGCGGGILSECLNRLGAKVTAIDMVNDVIEENKRRSLKTIQSNKVDYQSMAIENLVEKEDEQEKYDFIVASEVIEHVDNLSEFIGNSSKLLKSNGQLFLTSLNRTLFSYIFGIFAAEYVLNIVPRGTHDWNKFIDMKKLEELLKLNTLDTIAVRGTFFNPITNKWNWCQSKEMNFALNARKL